MSEAEHIAGIEHDLATAVDRRSRVSLDDIDADVLLRELARLRNQTMDFADVVNQLSEHMRKDGLSWAIGALVAAPDLNGYEKQDDCTPCFNVLRGLPMKLREALTLQSPSLALQRAAADEIARQDALIKDLLDASICAARWNDLKFAERTISRAEDHIENIGVQ